MTLDATLRDRPASLSVNHHEPDFGGQLVRTVSTLGVALFLVAGCSTSTPERPSPDLAPRGTQMTTAKPTRQDLTSKVSLSGKVTINPVFGLVSPVAGQVRYLDVKVPEKTPAKPTKAANVFAGGKATSVEIPAGAIFSGRLADDKATVAAGQPIVSAKHVGYGIVAEIKGEQAYQLSDTLSSVQAQIKNGPGPFPCAVLGTIAALPAGTIPDPPPAQTSTAPTGTGAPSAPAAPPPASNQPPADKPDPSEATGMRLVCTAPADVKLINGAESTIEVVTEKAIGVLVLPVEAVAGGQGKGKVDVLGAKGERVTKDVVLGLTDGKVVQIKSGLTEDETVAVPGPNLPPAPREPNGPGGTGK
ncbi:Efflux RND transporter periplasmic adaptor subunit [Kibdelosporangium sp. 4NS15]|uniref:Efflux RND transporter periplasmic adaptor subunit n=1 Tax=Kibdelosporangium persicum TaxID=2698649 RepID=A0ABX2EV72_9PSEU|nr:Efflux RND transporter periplasmic adaptor subunit [Kibdelosporangium persicum]